MSDLPHILKTLPSKDYALLDSGEGEKLERFGSVILSRPDPQALWPKMLPQKDWNDADGIFSRDARDSGWRLKNTTPERWQIELGGLQFWIRPTNFKHVGIFPEQGPNWSWIEEIVSKSDKKLRVLNLFGYTGGASLAAAKAGADVCHLDGSKTAINWAKDNAALSGLSEAPIRWILDDARAFLRREIKRGKTYDGIILDPPAFGHGPNGELWKIEEHFLDLLDLCRQSLSEDPKFMLINGYASGYSSIAYANNLTTMMKEHKGTIELGELAIAEEASSRLLPCGIFARWHAI